MIKAVIFDLNGIFIQSPKLSERFEKDFNVPIHVFLPKLSEIMDKVRQPNAGGAFKYWEPVLDEWNINLSEQEFWDYWFKAEIVSKKMVSFSTELRAKGVKVFILSNNFKERADYYEHYPWIHETVDKIYFSWKSGFIKPNPQAWLQILSENALKPEECLYFDDQDKNLTSAESIGITSFMFIDEESLQNSVIEKLGKS